MQHTSRGEQDAVPTSWPPVCLQLTYNLPTLQVGMNLGGFAYYGSQWPFNDIMAGCSGSGTEYPPQAGEDVNGFPIAIDTTADQCANGATTNYLGQPCSGLY